MKNGERSWGEERETVAGREKELAGDKKEGTKGGNKEEERSGKFKPGEVFICSDSSVATV